MPSATPANCFKLVMGFEAERGGWQEVYPLSGAAANVYVPAAQFIFTSRMSILPKEQQCNFARIVNTLADPSTNPNARRQEYKLDARLWDSVALGTTGPVASWPCPGQWTNNNDTLISSDAIVPNDDNDAVEVRVFTADGVFGTKFLHGVPDANKKANALTPGVTIPTVTVASLSNPNGTSWIALLGEFIAVIRDKSIMLRKRKTTGGVMQLLTDPIADVLERGVQTKKLGRPFDQQRGRRNPR
jgi:hypothetical protein